MTAQIRDPLYSTVFSLVDLACEDLLNPDQKSKLIQSEIALAAHNEIKESEILDLAINCAAQNIKDDPDFDKIASRLLLQKIYGDVFGKEKESEFRKIYTEGFLAYIKFAVEDQLLDPRLASLFDLPRLGRYLVSERDNLIKYIGLITMMKRYIVRDRNNKIIETPQYFWMRVSMGLSLNEENPTETALRFYEKMSELSYLSAGSTLIGAGTINPRLSNCFVMEMQDSIEHIGKTVSDVMKLTKATGGIGLSVTKLRAEGSPIKKTNTFSSGPIPFAHIIDSAIRAVSRAGKKLGALCLYMENWHLNFPEFLDLKQNAGDEYRRTRTANTAVYLSDEFMRRVENDDNWYLFDPADVSDLSELYGDSFSKRYNFYVDLAEKGELKLFRKVRAREQFKDILISLQTTSHPWLTFKDAINERALNNNTGTIHLSNLCTEICLPQDENNIAVCNLASINLVRHLKNKEIDFRKLEDSVRLAVRQLDNLVDITLSTVPEADNANKNNRAIGLGVMGFTDTLEKLGFSYDSPEAFALSDRIFEFISYMAIDESCNLAAQRGSYPNFNGSRWSEGFTPVDTLSVLERSRGKILEIEKGRVLDWFSLKEKVKKGVRNATLLAVAPTASIGLVAGTTPGIDPQFAQMFSRATNYGKFLEVNENLVNDLKNLGLWERVKDRVLENYGDISEIEEIPGNLKEIYKTSFNISPTAFIEVAGRAQKWVDQALSRNMYLSTRDVPEMVSIYLNAWRKGLKTTYYLHVKPRHTAEQSTSKVNKAVGIGKKGFSGLVISSDAEVNDGTRSLVENENSATPVSVSVDACPIDPAERANCESCQ